MHVRQIAQAEAYNNQSRLEHGIRSRIEECLQVSTASSMALQLCLGDSIKGCSGSCDPTMFKRCKRRALLKSASRRSSLPAVQAEEAICT